MIMTDQDHDGSHIKERDPGGVGSLESETWGFPQTEKKQQRYLTDVQQYVGLEG